MYTPREEKKCRILGEKEFLDEEKYKIEDCYSDHFSTFNQTLHFHDFYEISMIYEGESGFQINDTETLMGEGSVQLIRPTDYHCQKTEEGKHIRYYNLTFLPDVLPLEVQKAFRQKDIPLVYEFQGKEWRRTLELAQWLCSEYQNPVKDVVREEGILSGIRILCGLLYRKAQDTEEKESGSQNELVRQAVAYIQQNYRNPLTLKETAEYVGLSPSYFSAFFHKKLGMTFSGYLLDYRLKMAARYLKSSSLSLKEIGSACGFAGYSYFLTSFKKKYGVPPASYRKQKKELTG